MPIKDLLIPYAQGPDGRIVHVDSVPNGKDCGCRCPACGKGLVAKNAGKVKRSHFAHEVHVLSCEGWLHKTAKWMLYWRIADAIAAGENLPIQ